MKNNSSKLGLIKKALYIWAVQYHFVIPKEILKTYIHKFKHESENISKYGQRYYDPSSVEEYNKWLTMQEYDYSDTLFTDITFVGRNVSGLNTNGLASVSMKKLDTSRIHTKYTCLVNEGIHLYEPFFSYLNQMNDADVIYFDHDVYQDGQRRDPKCKPDFSYHLLRGFNYIGNLIIVKTELLKQFDRTDINIYEYVLELSDQKVNWKHISKILYGDSECDCFDVYPLKKYIDQHHIDCKLNMHLDCAYLSYPVKDKPLVSIMIPTKDGVDDLKKCIDSIFEKSTYKNFEIIIIDNNSEKEETFTYFKKLKEEHDNVFVHALKIPFNFSIINNKAVEYSSGEYVVLMNNDTEVITNDWLEKMLSYAQLENVGGVGVKLYYGDGTIQHGGVIAGKGGGFAHRYYRKPHDEKGYLHTLDIPNEVACCTAACLMIPKKKYLEVGGMNEELSVQFNDVDLGLRLISHGYSNLFLPDVELYHYESKSRGIDKEKKAVERYVSEVDYAQKNYASWIEHDPFYNDNFDKNYDYMLKVGTGSN